MQHPYLFLTVSSHQGYIGDDITVKAQGDNWDSLNWTVLQPHDAWMQQATSQNELTVQFKWLGQYVITCEALNTETGERVADTVRLICLENSIEVLTRRIEKLEQENREILKLLIELEAIIAEGETDGNGSSRRL